MTALATPAILSGMIQERNDTCDTFCLSNDKWLPSDLVHSPIVTDNSTFSFDPSRHFIRCVNFVNRDPIFRDFFTKLDKRAAAKQ